MLRIGDWNVNPNSSEISREGRTTRLEARTMRLLLCLAEHAGEVVSIDDLLNQVWPGVIVTQDSVYQAVASLRRFLGDDPKQPNYIVTVPRLGYRMVATVRPWSDLPNSQRPAPDPAMAVKGSSEIQDGSAHQISIIATDSQKKSSRRFIPRSALAAAAACLALVVASALRLHDRFTSSNHTGSSVIAAKPEKSVAVLPFLDLTDGMKEEEFADGMTEELIDKLSKLPDLRVPAPTSSFYFKNKQIPVADIAKALGVAYVLDGSVRKSGTRLRIATRLVRADSGYIIWSETYDRPFDDKLKVQDQIANEVARALRLSIEDSRSLSAPSS